MTESYEELMLPLFLRLGGEAQQLHMDQPDEDAPAGQGVAAAEAANALASVHRAAARALEEQVLALHLCAKPRFL